MEQGSHHRLQKPFYKALNDLTWVIEMAAENDQIELEPHSHDIYSITDRHYGS